MACIIYYQNLDYDLLPTAKKRRMMPCMPRPPSNCQNFTTTTNNNNGSTNGSAHSSSNGTVYSPVNSYTNNNNHNHNSYSNSSNTSNKYQQHRPSSPQHENTSPYFQREVVVEELAQQPSRKATGNSFNNKFTFANQIETTSPRVYEEPNERLLLDTLKKYFNFTSFRGNQLNAVKATCRGLDTLILMPTGGGKSICYQLPAILSKGVTFVVSPLKSLIEDQVSRLRSLGIKTAALSGETSEEDSNDIYFDLRAAEPKYKLIYVTPEKINASGALINLFKYLHSRNLLARFVIDEAHCVSTWGSDFRPDYRKLGKLRQLFHDVPIMALTATAPPKVRDDIFDQLQMNRATGQRFLQSFNRPNLKFEVRVKSKGCITDICSLIRKSFQKQCGIIYCLSRNDCETVAEKLRDQGITSAPYHAGLSDVQRKKVFKAWSSSVFQVVCATIAFGMGIDKSDVRFVIHYSVPKSVEGYYQEAGRAGRDGDFASCILYFSKSDLYRMKSMLSKGFGRTAADRERDKTNLDHMIDYVENRNECRRTILLRYLGEEFNSKDCISHLKTACDNCLTHRGSKGGKSNNSNIYNNNYE